MSHTTILFALAALLSYIIGVVTALKYGVSITGVIKADIAVMHAKIDSLKENYAYDAKKAREAFGLVKDGVAKIEDKVVAVEKAIKK